MVENLVGEVAVRAGVGRRWDNCDPARHLIGKRLKPEVFADTRNCRGRRAESRPAVMKFF